MQPWYRVVTPREEVRDGRSFSPDEFAIALEQVVAGTAPVDYSDPAQFFSRTYFSRALTEHSGMALRRLAGRTSNTAPVLTLVTQFGGGKTHTLTTLYHLAKNGLDASAFPGVSDLLKDAGIPAVPDAKVGVFVGNSWDPSDGRETPWIDLARQIAGDNGVAALGSAALDTPPGTATLSKVFDAADGPVLLLLDEVLNFINRHRNMAESFHAFIQNLTVASAGRQGTAAVISLPRSQVEMTDWDAEWQERITKLVSRVARNLMANDESEISEVVRRRLFEDLGNKRTRQIVAKKYADWCFERVERLPSEWTSVDTAVRDSSARDYLKSRFAACYPFHPATLSVFTRKWRALQQFQQTRGALAMLAQWVSWASSDGFKQARPEPLITLGSAPLQMNEFRSALLGQIGEVRLDAAIVADIAGDMNHARALDADTKGALRDIHRRVGTAILFESSGGQADKVANLPELRFALGEPEVETTTIDTAANALESSGFFIRKVGSDGYRIHHQATLRKVVSDRRASLDENNDIKPAMRGLIESEFKKESTLPIVFSPSDSSSVGEATKLTLVVANPDTEWERGEVSEQIRDWTEKRGQSPRLYPGSLIWCIRRPGRELRDRIADWLAWQRVDQDMRTGLLGVEYDATSHNEVRRSLSEAEADAREEVWAAYRYVALSDKRAETGLKVIDLGIGQAANGDSLCGRVIAALKSEALLNESVGAGYVGRHWPPAFEQSGAWPLTSLRQSFLDGSLTRLLDPDATLQDRIPEFVEQGEFGLASGLRDEGGYDQVWYKTLVDAADVIFESDIYLLTKEHAEDLQPKPEPQNDSLQASYLNSHWPPAFREAGAWPLSNLLQSVMDDPLIKLFDPDATLRGRISEFVEQGEFGLASGRRDDGKYSRVWYKTPVDTANLIFDSDLYLLTQKKAEELTVESVPPPPLPPGPTETVIRITGEVPSEVWNRIGVSVLPKLKTADEMTLEINLAGVVKSGQSEALKAQLEQAIVDLGLSEKVTVVSE